jgi:hypothetical protein
LLNTRRGRLTPALFLFCALLFSGCGNSSPEPAAKAQDEQIIWNHLATWTGSGDAQLDSFTSDTGALRIEWDAKPARDAAGPGTFRVAIHSSISGRPLAVPVDHRGPGSGTAFVSEEPRVFFADVSAQDLDWRITISERLR